MVIETADSALYYACRLREKTEPGGRRSLGNRLMSNAPTIGPAKHDEPAADALVGGLNDQDAPGLTWLNPRMRDLLMRAPSAIGITARPLHRWVYVDIARATMAGRTKLEDFVGKTVRESYPELAGQPFFAALDGVYTTGIPFIGKELKATKTALRFDKTRA